MTEPILLTDNDYGVAAGPTTDGQGNVSVDPLFADPGDGDLHLSSISVLRDAGSCVVPTDIDGDVRPTGPGCDIGADELGL